jgi:hypothetical protein
MYGSTTTLTAVEYLRALGRFDLDKKKGDVDAYVARGFHTTIDKLKPRDFLPIQKFMENLGKGILYRG